MFEEVVQQLVHVLSSWQCKEQSDHPVCTVYMCISYVYLSLIHLVFVMHKVCHVPQAAKPVRIVGAPVSMCKHKVGKDSAKPARVRATCTCCIQVLPYAHPPSSSAPTRKVCQESFEPFLGFTGSACLKNR